MIEQEIAIPTKAGEVDSFICHPERGGPWPVILFLMDAPGMREELRNLARRFATVGYYVLLPDLYHRHGPGGVVDTSALTPDSPERQRMFQMMDSLTNALLMEDVESLLAFVDHQPAARPGGIGCVGYCMSGPFAFTVAGTFPERIAAAASIYGVRFLTEAPDSPHLLASRIKGEVYFACAETDHWAPLPMVDPRRCAPISKRPASISRSRSMATRRMASPSRSARSSRRKRPSAIGSGFSPCSGGGWARHRGA